MAVAALGVSSVFAVYTFVGPYVTDAAGADASLIPVALAIFGLGMALGNSVGGRLADEYDYRGLVLGYASVLVFLVLIALGGDQLALLFPALFEVGATMMMAIPTIQVLLTRYAPEAPTLMGALNLASLNLANAPRRDRCGTSHLGGMGNTLHSMRPACYYVAGLMLFAVTVPKVAPPQVAEPIPATA